MTQDEAIKHLRAMMVGVQKLRSICDEDGTVTDRDVDGLHLTSEQASDVWKWIWGKNCVLSPLSKVIDRYEETNVLSPHDFYNMMYIATSLEPMIAFAAAVSAGDTDFPSEVDLQWLKGWDT